VPFKSNATGSRGGDWQKAFHLFKYHQDEFYARYHQRSNIESTNWMVKAKFQEEVRSKHDVSMMNEVLCKFICHNVCCVIQSMYEFGVAAEFLVPVLGNAE
jgi:transposase